MTPASDTTRKALSRRIKQHVIGRPQDFYTITLPATLWFFDRAKTDERILFIDARNIFTQIDRAHREFTPAQIEFIANVVRLYRGREVETGQGSGEMTVDHFPEKLTPGLIEI